MNSNTRIRAVVIVMFLVMGGLLYSAYTRMQQNISGLVQTVKESSQPDLTLLRISPGQAGTRKLPAAYSTGWNPRRCGSGTEGASS